MGKIRNFLNSDISDSISISTLLYSIFLFVLSLVYVSIPTNNPDTISIISLYEETILDESIVIDDLEEMVFDEKESFINEPIGSVGGQTEEQEEININPSFTLSEDSSQTQLPPIESYEHIDVGIGNTTDQLNNVASVLDRLTPEIVSLAEKRDINIIWLFDASISLSNQRKQIKDRISKILEEIKEISFSSKQIKHSVCSFGQSLTVISTEPTNDQTTIEKDIENIKLDESGIENIFSSIIKLCDIYKDKRNAIIVFTDEVGDDIQNLEKCGNITRQKNIPIYVVGPLAPFGISSIEFKYIDPDPKFDQKEKWVSIQQGPETLFKMTLDLHSLPIDDENLDSGYGPYALTRLCYLSSGLYFAINPNRSSVRITKKDIEPLSSSITKFFDSSVMRKYQPDYRNMITQQHEINSNPLKSALIKACQIPLVIVSNQKTSFTAFSEAEFVDQLKDAQSFSAKLEPKLDQIYKLLKDVEPVLSNINDKRWIASYSLAMGRILATKCRIESYNNILAEAKSGLKKQDKKTNGWELKHDNSLNTKNSQLNKFHENAIKYLESVVDNYPNTPWAEIAQSELGTPMGYKWTEKYIEQAKPKNMTPTNNNNNPRKDDQIKKLEMKPQRKIDKI